MSDAAPLRARTVGWVLVGAGLVGLFLAVGRAASGVLLAVSLIAALVGAGLASLRYVLRGGP